MMDKYREIVEQFASERIDQRISNGLPQHASILIDTMFKHAASDICIYSGDLNSEAYGTDEMLRSAKKFLSKPRAKLRILLQNSVSENVLANHPLLASLASLKFPPNQPHGSVEVRCAIGNYATDEAHHFAVMDAVAYRFEIDHNNTKAVANFNEPSVATELREAFDDAFGMAKKTVFSMASVSDAACI